MANNYSMERAERLYNPALSNPPSSTKPSVVSALTCQTSNRRNTNTSASVLAAFCSLGVLLWPAGPPWSNTASTTSENWWDTRWTYRWSTTAPYVDWTPEFRPTFLIIIILLDGPASPLPLDTSFPRLTWEGPPPSAPPVALKATVAEGVSVFHITVNRFSKGSNT